MAPGTSAVSVDQLRPFSGRLPMAWSSTALPSAAPVWSNSTLLAVTVISSLRLDGASDGVSVPLGACALIDGSRYQRREPRPVAPVQRPIANGLVLYRAAECGAGLVQFHAACRDRDLLVAARWRQRRVECASLPHLLLHAFITNLLKSGL